MVIGKWTWLVLFQGIRQWGLIAFIASVGCCASGSAAASQPSHEGPRLSSIAYVASNPEIVFAAGDGVFKSTDGGASWVGLKVPFSYGHVMTDPHHAARVIVLQDMHGSDHGDYQESLDGGDTWVPRHIAQRKDNVAGPFFFRLLMHPSRPGVWIAQGVDRLWTTQDAGVSWEVGPDLGLPRTTSGLVVASKAFYASAAAQVWRSEDGKNWLPVGSPKGSDVQGMVLVAGDRVAVKSGDDWWTRSEQGAWEPGLSFPDHESGKKLSADQKGPFTRSIDRCWPVQSPADSAYLVASCRKASTGVSIDYSAQLHSFDAGLNWSSIGGAGLPSAWFPSVIAPHPRDSGSLLMAWVSGRVFRSQDHGSTWQASDAGLVAPRVVRDFDTLRGVDVVPLLEYPRETPLNRAVLAHDLVTVKHLAATGVDMDERGPARLSAVEWALVLGANVAERGDAMYWELRGLGASAPSQSLPSADQVWRAVEHGNFGNVFEDLLKSGWSLSRKLGQREDTLLGRLVRGGCQDVWKEKGPAQCASTLAGRPLGFWVDLHLAQALPGQSAQLSIDLARLGQTQLAEQVLSFDSGRYGSPRDVVALLEALPEESPLLRRKVVDGYKGRFEQLSAGGGIYDALKIGAMPMDWVLDVLPIDRGAVTPEHAALLVQALLGQLNRPDWVAALVRGKRGPRINDAGWQEVSDALVLSCDPRLLTVAMRHGVSMKQSLDGDYVSSVRAALRACKDKDLVVLNAQLASLYRAGLRMRGEEIFDLDALEIHELQRSVLWPRYERQFGRIGGVGVRLSKGHHLQFPRVEWVVEGYPAQRAGIAAGDRVIAVNDENLWEVSLADSNLLIRGKVGTKVALTVERRGGERFVVHLRRKSLGVGSVLGSVEK